MLPEKFKERMKLLLGCDYPAFEEALSEDPVRAVRINREKDKDARFLTDAPYGLSEIEYATDAYVIEDGGSGIGNTPYHHGGAIYVQDPGAMISAEATEIREGMLVADLCAAPGGKTSQIAAKLGGTGFLLSNEFVPKRARILVGNIERLGIKNALVTSADTGELAKLYSAVFDLVITDAPCSGEGMFRKGEVAQNEWSEENVLSCKERQAYILDNAAKMVKSGGRIVYSTCTYSLEENEMTVDEFLLRHPDFRIVPTTDRVRAASSDGIVFDGAACRELNLARRFYPHISRGEGQFVAVLERTSEVRSVFNFKDALKAPRREEAAIVRDFIRDNLTDTPKGRLATYNNNLVLVSHGLSVPQCSVFSAGVLVGEIRGRLLIPSHQLFSAYGELFKRREELDDGRAEAYLRGEEIEAKELSSASGFCVLTYHGIVLGGGKVSSGRIKNHYPKGLRKN